MNASTTLSGTAGKTAVEMSARLKRRQTVSYYAALIGLGLVLASLGPTLPGLAEHTGAQIGAISFLFTARSLGSMSGAVLGGRLYDRRSGHPILMGTLTLMAIMLVLTPLQSQLWLLTGVLFLLGIGEGVLDVGVNTLVVWVHGAKVGPFMNALHFFFGVGAFVSPIIIAEALRRTGDITWAYWMLALLLLPILISFLRLPSPSAEEHRQERLGVAVDPWLVLLIAIFLGLYVAAEVSFAGWIYSYAVAMGLASITTAAYLTSAFWGAFTIGRLLSIPLAARMRPRTILLMNLGGALLSVGLVLLLPGSLLALWIGSAGMGLGLASTFPTALSLAERRMPITGRVTSQFFVGASLGAVTVPWLIGRLFEIIGAWVTMAAIGLVLLAAVVVLVILLWRSAPTRV